MDGTTYFEIFDYHPSPRNLESFTGYLTRIGEGNDINSVDGLTGVFFPDQDRRVIRALTDYPPISYGTLSSGLRCSVDRLRRTTLYHLVAKFDRSTHPQTTSRFLAGFIDPHLRFCPICITQYSYYFLTWRFRLLPGCLEHGCYLLNKCPNCPKPIRLLSAPLKIGFCHYCGFDLRHGPIHPLSDADQERTHKLVQDLEFLLTAYDWENDSPRIIKAVGRVLAHRREQLDLNPPDLAQLIDITPQLLTGMERANKNKGAAFNEYSKYLGYLGNSFKEIFDAVLNWQEKPSREHEVLAMVKNAYATLKAQDRYRRQQDIGDLIGMPLSSMRYYPSVAAFLAQISTPQV
jgi:hypothetical protein